MKEAFMKPIQDGGHYILYNDTGISLIDLDYPKAINVGISEAFMVGAACGIASTGKKVFCYAITPHFLNAWTAVRGLLVPWGLDVILCGFGEGKDYSSLGHSHQMDAWEMKQYCHGANIAYVKPDTMEEVQFYMRLKGPLFMQIPKSAVRR